jgi:hypothetical protein
MDLRFEATCRTGRAVEAIGEGPFDPVRRLLLRGRTLKCSIRLGESCRTGLRSIAEMPEHAPTGNRGEVVFQKWRWQLLWI